MIIAVHLFRVHNNRLLLYDMTNFWKVMLRRLVHLAKNNIPLILILLLHWPVFSNESIFNRAKFITRVVLLTIFKCKLTRLSTTNNDKKYTSKHNKFYFCRTLIIIPRISFHTKCIWKIFMAHENIRYSMLRTYAMIGDAFTLFRFSVTKTTTTIFTLLTYENNRRTFIQYFVFDN